MLGINAIAASYLGQGWNGVAGQTADAATITVAIGITSADIQDIHDLAEILVDIQPGGTETQQGSELSMKMLLRSLLTYSHRLLILPNLLIRLRLCVDKDFGYRYQGSGDSATILVDIQNMGGECYSTWSGSFIGEGSQSTLDGNRRASLVGNGKLEMVYYC